MSRQGEVVLSHKGQVVTYTLWNSYMRANVRRLQLVDSSAGGVGTVNLQLFGPRGGSKGKMRIHLEDLEALIETYKRELRRRNRNA